jgi:hypothetical protein
MNDNAPFGLLLERHLLDLLDRVPPERLAAFRKELEIYVLVGSTDECKLLINWVTVRSRTDERAVVLKVLDFLTKELAMQLVVRRDEDNRPRFEKPAPDTVLHEQGIRHDPELCQHCTHRGSPDPKIGQTRRSTNYPTMNDGYVKSYNPDITPSWWVEWPKGNTLGSGGWYSAKMIREIWPEVVEG